MISLDDCCHHRGPGGSGLKSSAKHEAAGKTPLDGPKDNEDLMREDLRIES
jgi:hypothetical protein